MSKDVVRKVSLDAIEPGDTCVFHIAVSFKKGHAFVTQDFERFLHSKIKEYFTGED